MEVPYLNTEVMWRTGANSGTTLTLSTPAKIGGAEVPAGTYLIITTPGDDQFDFILYGDPSIGSNFSKMKSDHILVNMKVDNLKSTDMIETLTFQISDLSADNTQANIHFQWADAAWKVPIEVSFDEIVMAEIAAKTQVDLSNYMAAASPIILRQEKTSIRPCHGHKVFLLLKVIADTTTSADWPKSRRV